MCKLLRTFPIALILAFTIADASHAQTGNAFGNAFSKPNGKTTSTPAPVPAKGSAVEQTSGPEAASANEPTPEFNDPQSMLDHVRRVTSTARDAERKSPGIQDQQQFIRRATGGTVAPEPLDPKAKIVDQIQPEWATGDRPLFGRSVTRDSSRKSTSSTTLSAFVPTTPKAQFQRTMEQIATLKKDRHIAIGNVVLVGSTEGLVLAGYDLSEIPAEQLRDQLRANPKAPNVDLSDIQKALKGATPAEAKILNSTGLTSPEELRGSNLLERYSISVLPAWIVEKEGTFHVFEGEYDPSEFFDPDGNFIADRW